MEHPQHLREESGGGLRVFGRHLLACTVLIALVPHVAAQEFVPPIHNRPQVDPGHLVSSVNFGAQVDVFTGNMTAQRTIYQHQWGDGSSYAINLLYSSKSDENSHYGRGWSLNVATFTSPGAGPCALGEDICETIPDYVLVDDSGARHDFFAEGTTVFNRNNPPGGTISLPYYKDDQDNIFRQVYAGEIYNYGYQAVTEWEFTDRTSRTYRFGYVRPENDPYGNDVGPVLKYVSLRSGWTVQFTYSVQGASVLPARVVFDRGKSITFNYRTGNYGQILLDYVSIPAEGNDGTLDLAIDGNAYLTGFDPPGPHNLSTFSYAAPPATCSCSSLSTNSTVSGFQLLTEIALETGASVSFQYGCDCTTWVVGCDQDWDETGCSVQHGEYHHRVSQRTENLGSAGTRTTDWQIIGGRNKTVCFPVEGDGCTEQLDTRNVRVNIQETVSEGFVTGVGANGSVTRENRETTRTEYFFHPRGYWAFDLDRTYEDNPGAFWRSGLLDVARNYEKIGTNWRLVSASKNNWSGTADYLTNAKSIYANCYEGAFCAGLEDRRSPRLMGTVRVEYDPAGTTGRWTTTEYEYDPILHSAPTKITTYAGHSDLTDKLSAAYQTEQAITYKNVGDYRRQKSAKTKSLKLPQRLSGFLSSAPGSPYSTAYLPLFGPSTNAAILVASDVEYKSDQTLDYRRDLLKTGPSDSNGAYLLTRANRTFDTSFGEVGDTTTGSDGIQDPPSAAPSAPVRTSHTVGGGTLTVQTGGSSYFDASVQVQDIFLAPTKMTDANGFFSTYEYDANGRVTKITPPTGEQPTAVSYPGATRASVRVRASSSLTDPDDQTVDYYYDEGLHLCATVTKTPKSVDPAASPKVNYAFVFTTQVVDTAGRTAATFAPQSDLDDQAGGGGGSPYRPRFGSWPTQTSFTSYDSQGRPTTIEDLVNKSKVVNTYAGYNGSEVTTKLYDVAVPATPVLKSEKIVTSDVLGNVEKVIEKNLAIDTQTLVTEYLHDEMGRLWAMKQYSAASPYTMPNSTVQWRYFRYDSLGRMTFEHHPETGDTTYNYNILGDLTNVVSASGRTTSTAYDAKGRPTTVTSALVCPVGATDCTPSTITSTMRYDSYSDNTAATNVNGRLTESTHTPMVAEPLTGLQSFSVLTRLKYAGLNGRLSQTAQTGTLTPLSGAAKATTFTEDLTYNSWGAVTTDTRTVTGGTPFTVTNTYQGPILVNVTAPGLDPAAPGTLNSGSVFNTSGVGTGLQFDAFMQAKQVDLATGLQRKFTRDNLGRLTSLDLTPWNVADYRRIGPITYGPQGGPTRIQGTRGTAPNPSDALYGYNSQNELVSAIVPALDGINQYNQTFAYEAFGNITSAVTTAPGGLQLDGSFSGRVYDLATNRAPGKTYDADGRMTGDGTTAGSRVLQYDAAGRLVRVRMLDNALAAQTRSQYFLDGAGERLLTATSSANGPSLTWTFRGAGGAVLMEQTEDLVNLRMTRTHRVGVPGAGVATVLERQGFQFDPGAAGVDSNDLAGSNGTYSNNPNTIYVQAPCTVAVDSAWGASSGGKKYLHLRMKTCPTVGVTGYVFSLFVHATNAGVEGPTSATPAVAEGTQGFAFGTAMVDGLQYRAEIKYVTAQGTFDTGQAVLAIRNGMNVTTQIITWTPPVVCAVEIKEAAIVQSFIGYDLSIRMTSTDAFGAVAYTFTVLTTGPAGSNVEQVRTVTRTEAETAPYQTFDLGLNKDYRVDVQVSTLDNVYPVGYVLTSITGSSATPPAIVRNCPNTGAPPPCNVSAPAVADAILIPVDRSHFRYKIRACAPAGTVTEWGLVYLTPLGKISSRTATVAEMEAGVIFGGTGGDLMGSGKRIEVSAHLSNGSWATVGCGLFWKEVGRGGALVSYETSFRTRGPAVESQMPADGSPILMQAFTVPDGLETQTLTLQFAADPDNFVEYVIRVVYPDGSFHLLEVDEVTAANPGVLLDHMGRFGDANTKITASIAIRKGGFAQLVPLGCVIVQFMEGLDCRDSGISIVPYEEGNSCFDERLIQTHLHVTDQMGHVTQVLDYQSTSIIEEHAYLPYGDLVPGGSDFCSGSSSESNDVCDGQGYLGQDRDEGAVGWNLHARMLFDGAYRFESPDPILNSRMTRGRGWNRYAYGLNNPLNFLDPRGTDVVELDSLKKYAELYPTLASVLDDYRLSAQYEAMQEDKDTTYFIGVGTAGGPLDTELGNTSVIDLPFYRTKQVSPEGTVNYTEVNITIDWYNIEAMNDDNSKITTKNYGTVNPRRSGHIADVGMMVFLHESDHALGYGGRYGYNEADLAAYQKNVDVIEYGNNDFNVRRAWEASVWGQTGSDWEAASRRYFDAYFRSHPESAGTGQFALEQAIARLRWIEGLYHGR